LDLLFGFSLSAAGLLLLAVLLVPRPLQLSMPTILEVLALCRIALCLAAVRRLLFLDHASGVVEWVGRTLVHHTGIVGGMLIAAVIAARHLHVILSMRATVQRAVATPRSEGAHGLGRALPLHTLAMALRSQLGEGLAIVGIGLASIGVGVVVGVQMMALTPAEAVSVFGVPVLGAFLLALVPARVCMTAATILAVQCPGLEHLRKGLRWHAWVWALGAVLFFVAAWLPGLPTLWFLAAAAAIGVFAFGVLRRSRNLAADPVEAQTQPR
jgi:type III secretory pathway component EscV